MKYYFHLQLLRLNRSIRESGFSPILAYPLLLIIFIVSSHLIINTVEQGNWIYILISLYLFSKIQNGALTYLIFTNAQLRKLHLFEAIIFSIPFSTILITNQFFLEGVILIFGVSISTLFSFSTNVSITIPTPFYKHPFEFISGFRKTWLIILILYGLCSIAINVGNFNLAVFAIALVYLNLISFYSKPENEFFVWSYAMNSNQFLAMKKKTSILFSTMLTVPMIIAIYIIFPDNWIVTTFLFLIGSLLPIVGVLNKYSYFPSQSESINSILIGSSLLFPPLLLFIIPYLINKAILNLKNYL